jgi:hypothetical protein
LKWKDTHQEQKKENTEFCNDENQEFINVKKKECYQAHKETRAEKAKACRQTHKDGIEARAGKKIPCERGMLIRRDWFSRNKLSLRRQEQL